MRRGPYYHLVDAKPITEEGNYMVAEPANAASEEMWHRRMGHPGKNAIEKMKIHTTGMKIIPDSHTHNEKCETCIKAKMTKRPFPKSTRRATKPMELIHTDVIGPFKTQTKEGGCVYVISFIDDYTRMIKVYLMKNK